MSISVKRRKKAERAFQYFEELPPELRNIIIMNTNLSVGDLDALSKTSSQYRRWINNPNFWEYMLQTRYPNKDITTLTNKFGDQLDPKWVFIVMQAKERITGRIILYDVKPSDELLGRMRRGEPHISPPYVTIMVSPNNDNRAALFFPKQLMGRATELYSVLNPFHHTLRLDADGLTLIILENGISNVLIYAMLRIGFWYTEFDNTRTRGSRARFVRSPMCSVCFNNATLKCTVTDKVYCSNDCYQLEK